MKPKKLLFGAAGFAISSSALFMGAGVAQAETTSVSVGDGECVECELQHPALDKIQPLLFKFQELRSPAADALQKVVFKISLLDKF